MYFFCSVLQALDSERITYVWLTRFQDIAKMEMELEKKLRSLALDIVSACAEYHEKGLYPLKIKSTDATDQVLSCMLEMFKTLVDRAVLGNDGEQVERKKKRDLTSLLATAASTIGYLYVILVLHPRRNDSEKSLTDYQNSTIVVVDAEMAARALSKTKITTFLEMIPVDQAQRLIIKSLAGYSEMAVFDSKNKRGQNFLARLLDQDAPSNAGRQSDAVKQLFNPLRYLEGMHNTAYATASKFLPSSVTSFAATKLNSEEDITSSIATESRQRISEEDAEFECDPPLLLPTIPDVKATPVVSIPDPLVTTGENYIYCYANALSRCSY